MRNRPIVWFWSFVLCFLFVGIALIENPAKAGDTNAMNLAPRTESSDSNRERHPLFCIIPRVSGGTWSVIKVS